MASCLGNFNRSKERKVLLWGMVRLLLIPLISWAILFVHNGISIEALAGTIRFTVVAIFVLSALLAPVWGLVHLLILSLVPRTGRNLLSVALPVLVLVTILQTGQNLLDEAFSTRWV